MKLALVIDMNLSPIGFPLWMPKASRRYIGAKSEAQVRPMTRLCGGRATTDMSSLPTISISVPCLHFVAPTVRA